MEPVAIVLALALIEYFAFGILVGRARGQYGVEAPATTGHPVFERYHRVHQNTLEQLVIFLPAVALFAHYVSPSVAAGLGVVFLVGRALYAAGYIREPRKRGPGFLVTVLVQAVLVVGALVGAVGGLL